MAPENPYGRADYQEFEHPSETIPQDEPVFLLRAQDINAAQTILFWAELNERNGGDIRLSDLAREHAKRMEMWPIKKLPDFKTYIGSED